MMIEYEKTYLLKYIPEDLKSFPSEEYLDIYVPKSADHPILRVRKRGNEYEITKKYPVDLQDSSKQHEFTIPITKEEFNELEANLEGKRSKKQRFYYKYQNILVEIDVFKDGLKGLILADFEFKTEKEKGGFTPPDFCLAEVTQEKVTAGGMIAGKKYSEIEPILANYGYKPLFLD